MPQAASGKQAHIHYLFSTQ